MLNQAILIQSNHAQSYCNLGVAYKELEKTEEAMNYYKKAIAIKPDFANAHNNLGIIFKELDEIEQRLFDISNLSRRFQVQPENLNEKLKFFKE